MDPSYRGSLSRTIHYRTFESVSEAEFRILINAIELMNSYYSWEVEKLKLWRDGVFSDSDQVWGFTKVLSDFEAEKVVFSIWYISLIIPRLSWILVDDGFYSTMLTFVKNGGLVNINR